MPSTMSFASPADMNTIHAWREAQCLEPFIPEKFHPSQAIGICSDGNRPHMLRWALNQYDVSAHCCEGVPRIFRYESHGIAMRFGMGNPLTSGDIAWMYHLPQFEQAQRFAQGQLQQFNLWHHWPCGAALDAVISLAESVVWTLLSKDRIKDTGIFKMVTALLWVDVSEGNHEIYRMKLEQFVEYFKKHAPRLYQMLQAQHQYLTRIASARAMTSVGH